MAFALLMMAPDSAQAAEYNLTMSECDDTSFTVTWDKPELEGTIEAYHIYDTEIEDYIADLSPESTGFTTTDLIKGYVGRLYGSIWEHSRREPWLCIRQHNSCEDG